MENNLQIIKTYCGDVEDRIRSCRSKEIAELLTDRLCSEVDKGCKSSIINGILKSHINKIIEQVFDQDGNNRFLEDLNEKQTRAF